MILFPPAKINLGLNVLYKREDGFHELETCMLPVPFTDVLEILPAKEFTFHQTGLLIPGKTEGNSCIKAFDLMTKKYSIPPVYIHLRKEIPMGAGLGGGSSDAASVLKGINELFELNCTDEELEILAAQIGSDCPFFIKNKPQIAKGRGEILSSCNLNLNGFYLKIVNPRLHIGTKEAYTGIVFGENQRSVQEIVESPLENWKMELKNDFETSIFTSNPLLAKIKEKLYDEGALYAAMSGSGSTLFGIFHDEPNLSFSANRDYLEVIRKI